MFNKTIDVVITTYLHDIIEKKLIDKASFPNEYKNIKNKSSCPLSIFADKFKTPDIRSCNGLSLLFEKSLLLKSCADFYFKSNNESFESSSPSRLFNVAQHLHDEIQVTPFKFYPKIMYPAFIETKQNIPFLMHKAFYHSKNNRIYPSGVIKREFCPNVIFELEKNTEDFVEYFEPLLYITAMTEKKIKVHYNLITQQEFESKSLMYERRKFAKQTITG